MNPKLFKSAEFYQRRYHNFATLLIIPLILFVSFLVIFSLVAKKEVTVTSQGEIAPTNIIASIQSTSNNTIITNNLTNNQLVEKDEVIIQYSETMEDSQKQAIESQLALLKRQKTGLETLKSSLEQGTNLFSDEDEFGYIHTFHHFIQQSQDIELSISKTNTEIEHQTTIASNTLATIDTQINAMYQQIAEYGELRQAIMTQATSLSSDNPHQATLHHYLAQSQEQQPSATAEQYISQINQSISGLENSIASLKIQRAGIGTVSTYDNSLGTKIEVLRTQFLQTASQQLTTVENQLTDLTAQLNQATIRLDSNTITAPETGIVHLNSEFEGKTLIPSGSEIAQLYPDIRKSKEIFITYYVTSEYVSLLKEDQVVRLSLEKIGNKSLMIRGNIQSIDKAATKTEQGNLFKITAIATLSDEDSSLIQYGLQGRVTSVIAKKTYFDYYKDKILSNSQ
ncbi:bacteriocin secretion accessory protein [Streptococcus acidominimus]|uniref:Bacteriocin secretion accessory protein n=1 Tax=Streptococcus acidominimus TaxID=1326 RepID=A0A4Y9FRK0_STRAI|nr:bacteriocin secretion accessory protein [Streptococcus acidominimus]MBF0818198.1 bacteriocin secretion accessory protein [Streptococcus acidominimus]MBF0838515.1 bacteriocin secretion accessory protein [Streptococcus acidominimus]MBF0848447.1 bacteriocin secretion accessory protein [Streptococcus danieliae]TFU31502.1 bacteriocin secretion accessory protein [Streptococcus acidominimus]